METSVWHDPAMGLRRMPTNVWRSDASLSLARAVPLSMGLLRTGIRPRRHALCRLYMEISLDGAD